MKIFNDFRSSIRAKLILGVTLMLVPLIALGLSSFLSMDKARKAHVDSIHEIRDEIMPMMSLHEELENASFAILNFTIKGEVDSRNSFQAAAKKADRHFKTLLGDGALGESSEQKLVRSARTTAIISYAGLGEPAQDSWRPLLTYLTRPTLSSRVPLCPC